MVGVPGRSKGCNTCRRRKIACSLDRPECKQCIKSKRVCGGYQRDRVFIHSHGIVDDDKTVASRAIVPSEKGPCSSASQKKWPLLLYSRSEERQPPWSNALMKSPVPLGNNGLQCMAYRQQLLSAFLVSYIPTSQHDRRQDKSWLVLLPDLPTITIALETSILAVCTAKLGRLHEDQTLVNQSLILYTQGLSELQKALWNPALMYADETLAACLALAMYEIMECPAGTKRGYITHQHGCARLVHLRGARAYGSEFSHQLFRSFRLLDILQAMEEHRPTFLMDPAWTKLPWKMFPKSPFDKILDVLVEAPDIFRDADRLKHLEPRSLLLKSLEIVDRCWRLEVELRRTYEEIENSIPGPIYWPELSTEESSADDPELGKLFPVAFHFLNIRVATLVMFYWMALTMVWSGLTELYKVIASLQFDIEESSSLFDGHQQMCSNGCDSNMSCNCTDKARKIGTTQYDMTQLPTLDYRTNFISMVRNICQSVEYCMQDEMLGMGLGAVAAPLATVIEYVKEYPEYRRELLWAKVALNRVHKRGFRIVRHMKKL